MSDDGAAAAGRRYRAIAEAVARHAGRALRAGGAAWARAERVDGHDVKLTGDRAAERIAAELLIESTALAVYSEEAGFVGAPSGDLLWVLDPLDGSANYQRAVPLAAVSLALVEAGTPVLGVIYDFHRDELFSGVPGDGAWLNDAPMRVSAVTDPGAGILTTGFPVAMDHDSAALGAYVAEVQRFRKVRSLGTAALMLAYVAAGRFDVYRERQVRFWDVAAGMALVTAAGGRVRESGDESGPGRRLDLLAWNGVMALEGDA